MAAGHMRRFRTKISRENNLKMLKKIKMNTRMRESAR